MSSLFKNFKMDEKKESKGVPVQPAPTNDDGTMPTFFVTRLAASNQKYNKVLDRETKPYKRQIQLGTLSSQTSDLIRMKVFVNSILQGWENVQDEKCLHIPFSAENALALFKQLPDLFFELEKQASDASLFRSEEVEETAKN